MKKALALALSLVMMLAALPFSAFAADCVLVDSVSITIETDLDGVSVQNYENYITINTVGLEFEDNYDDPAVFVDTVDTEEMVETFVEGETYNVMVCLSALDGYCLQETYVDVPASVNGLETVTYCDYWYPTDDITVFYYVLNFELTVGDGIDVYDPEDDLPEDDPDAIKHVDLSVLPTTEQKIGEWADYITINTENVDFDDDYGFPGVYVYDAETGERLDERLYFVAGKTYDITVSVAPEEGSSISYYLTANVNGFDADYVYVSTYYPTNDESFELQYAEISYYGCTVEGSNSIGNLLHNFFVNLVNFFSDLFVPVMYAAESCKTAATKF